MTRILIALCAAVTLWGWLGHHKANRLQASLGTANQHVAQVTGERDKARAERTAALDAAQQCSASVAALEQAALEQQERAKGLREQAKTQAQKHQQRALQVLAAKPTVPNDDAKSAQQRVWQWLAERKEGQQ